MSYLALPLALVLVLLVEPARGSDVLWIDPLGGFYHDPGNWLGATMPPGPGEIGVFDLDATYAVELAAPPENTLIRLARGDVTFDLNGAEFPFSFEIGDQIGRLAVVDGALSRSLVLDAQESDFPGFLRIGEGARLQSAFLDVGFAWEGALDVVDGGLASADFVVAGNLQSGVGSLFISGAGSQLDVSGGLVVAFDGYGQLDVLDRGLLTTNSAVIAEASPSAFCCGVVTVAGAGSTWVNNSDLVVGGATIGSIAIEAGGRITTRNAFLGLQGLLVEEGLAGEGMGVVTGPGSLLRVSEALVLGGDLGDEPPSVEPGGPGGFGTLVVSDAARATVGQQLVLWNEARCELSGGAIDVGSLASSALAETVLVHPAGGIAGTGTLVGAVNVAGTLDPGGEGGGSGVSSYLLELGYVSESERLLRIEGDVAFTQGSELRIDLAGDAASGPGIGYDSVEAIGAVELGGILAIDVAPEVRSGLTASDKFVVLFGAAGVSGAFENAPSGALFSLGSGLGWLRAFYGPTSPYNPGSIVVTGYQTVPEPVQPLLVAVGAAALGLRGRKRGRA